MIATRVYSIEALTCGKQIPIVLPRHASGCPCCGDVLLDSSKELYCSDCGVFRCEDCGFWRRTDDGSADTMACNACWFDDYVMRRLARRQLARGLRARVARRVS